jgi:eukaryotic-like serine/threonine-protein kinase
MRRGLEVTEHVPGPNERHVASNLVDQGEMLVQSGDLDAAEAALRRAQEIGEKRELLEYRVKALGRLAMVRRAQGRPAQALELDQRALELSEKLPAHLGLERARIFEGVAEDRLALRQPAQAIDPLERALELRQGEQVAPPRSAGRDPLRSGARALGRSAGSIEGPAAGDSGP